MPKNTPKQEQSGILKDAKMPLQLCRGTVHKINGKKVENCWGKPIPEGNSGALYIGKTIIEPISTRIRAVLTGKEPGPQNIYSEEFIQSALENLGPHLRIGNKICIVQARCLSEIFNGPTDTENALTIERQRDFIRKIAKKIGIKEEQLEFIDLEDQVRHSQLFLAVRMSIDPATGKFDPEMAFGADRDEDEKNEPFRWPESVSLDIAKCLYEAYKAHPEFADLFRETIPKGLAGDREDQSDQQNYYSLVEIACRIADLKHGTSFQCGAGRQARYDKIIEDLRRGEKGQFKKYRELKPIFDLLKGATFQTLHFFTDADYRGKKLRRTRARTKIAAMAAIGLTTLGTAAFHSCTSEMRQREEQEQLMEEKIREGTRHIRFRFEGFFMDEQENVKMTLSIANSVLGRLKERYQMGIFMNSELKPLVIEFLLASTGLLQQANQDAGVVNELADLFVKKHSLFLAQKGLNTTQPFANFTPYMDKIKEAAVGMDDFQLNTILASPNPGNFDDVESVNDLHLKKIGKFTPSVQYGWTQTLYIYEKNGETHILGRDMSKEDPKTVDRVFTAKEGRELAQQFLSGLRKYDTLQIADLRSTLSNMCYNKYNPGPKEKSEPAESNPYSPYTFHYKDSLGEFDYYLRQSYFMDKTINHSIDIILARRPGESQYTYETGMEVARKYCNI
ncbi:hypothetical protein KJ951_01790, partial [Patescibacteria group bacterium]|nr:hypothetical protein [Patescibacteria group bacterium]